MGRGSRDGASRGGSARWAAIGIASIALATASSPANAQPKRRTIARVVAVVDEQCITSAELERRVQQALRGVVLTERDPAAREARLALIRRQVLDQLVDARLIVGEAARRGLDVTAAEVEQAFDTIQKQNGLDRAGLLAALREQGMDEASYRRELVAQLAELKLVRNEIERVRPGWAKLDEAAQRASMQSTRDALVQSLRTTRFVEVRT